MTDVVEEATEMGDMPAPLLIDDLVDTYEVEAQGFSMMKKLSFRT